MYSVDEGILQTPPDQSGCPGCQHGEKTHKKTTFAQTSLAVARPAFNYPPIPLPATTTARTTDDNITDAWRRTDAGVGVVPVMVPYPGTPCT